MVDTKNAAAVDAQLGDRPVEDRLADIVAGERLCPGHLLRECDLRNLTFSTVDELPDPPGVIGQQRAVEAVGFATGIKHKGFNLFALGPSGTGRRTLLRSLLEQRAAGEAVPCDWCYANNFDDPRRPRLLKLPTGRAVPLRDAMRHLVDELQAALPAAFERDDYRARRDALEQKFKERQEEAFNDLQERAEKRNVALLRTPVGLALAAQSNGEVLRPEVFATLPVPGADRRRRTRHSRGKRRGRPAGGGRLTSEAC